MPLKGWDSFLSNIILDTIKSYNHKIMTAIQPYMSKIHHSLIPKKRKIIQKIFMIFKRFELIFQTIIPEEIILMILGFLDVYDISCAFNYSQSK